MLTIFQHEFDFDPSYGYDNKQLLTVEPGQEPQGFTEFWQRKYQQALTIKPFLSIQDTGRIENSWRIFDCYYDSAEGIRIGGWLLLPSTGQVEKALVWAHGYGGIESPDSSWILKNTALLIPCMRGIGRSARAPISSESKWHVLHDIQDKDKYILGGCVQDIWCGVSALLSLFPQTSGNIGFCGSSFGGGLGVFASAFDSRIKRAHFHVPTFGNLKVRMALPCIGSTQSVRDFAVKHADIVAETLPFFDASVAARYLLQPTHWALARFDPFVAPPGQYSVYNACRGHKQLYSLDAGHFVYIGQGKQKRELRRNLEQFFNVRV
ncbi:acetylxylan esterase [Vibrio algarum]|uniref:Acetylxylan esterase n=1 Tax=Vibrio algarum TaxID=3020714 RepID=A0ABT4YRP9_9VIBR|nr:acetylxylan esterase [Vibrio sp. KJ40-1]MDB1124082.1 acetylxylan esterase [Vibrio sp. KJ40-1]